MKKSIVIADMPVNGNPAIVTVLYVDDRARELFVQFKDRRELLGGIYVGQVERIQENVNAAYVRIGKDLNVYMALDEGRSVDDFVMKTRREEKSLLRGGDELLVQVEKEALKTKLPRATGNLSFTGKYLVLTTRLKKLSFSRKLDPEQKIRLRKIFPKKCCQEFGLIVRTNAAEASQEELWNEYEKLLEEARAVCNLGPSRSLYTELKAPDQDWIRAIRQCASQDLDWIQTDIPEIYDYICDHTKELGISQAMIEKKTSLSDHVIHLKKENDSEETVETLIRFYQDDLVSLYQIKNLKTLLSHCLSKQVELKSGGNIVIEETEAFVVIDINSGRYDSHKDSEEARVKINFEAAEAIAEQIRLRQLSGTILIDFINMSHHSQEKKLIEYMEQLVRQDSVKCKVVDITPLGIMELTREKKRKPLREQVFIS